MLLGGGGVALSTAIGRISSITSWIANLSAIAFGGAVYSSLKNMEVAESIMAQQRKIVKMKERFSLPHYHIKPEGYSSSVEILYALRISNAEEIIRNAEEAQIQLKRHIPEVRKYAYINAGFQILPSLYVIIVNTLANLEKTQASSGESSDLTSIQLNNLIGVILCISTQYVIHTAYAARKLGIVRKKTNRLHSMLEHAQDSLLFRAIEFNAFRRSCADIEAKKGQCDAEIARITQRIADLSQEIAGSEQQISKLEKDIASEQRKLVLCNGSLQECETQLGEIKRDLKQLRKSPEENRSRIKYLRNSKRSLIKKQAEINKEIMQRSERVDSLYREQEILPSIIDRKREEIDVMEETLETSQHQSVVLEEEHTQLILETPKKSDELAVDIGRVQQLMQV